MLVTSRSRSVASSASANAGLRSTSIASDSTAGNSSRVVCSVASTLLAWPPTFSRLCRRLSSSSISCRDRLVVPRISICAARLPIRPVPIRLCSSPRFSLIAAYTASPRDSFGSITSFTPPGRRVRIARASTFAGVASNASPAERASPPV